MKTTIKIHDKKWFAEHCVVLYTKFYSYGLKPKYPAWKNLYTLHWPVSQTGMNLLTGQVLEVEHDDGDKAGVMRDARYLAGGHWIPNWAIEWVKEESDNREE